MLRKDILRLVSSPISEIIGASIAALLLWVGARDVLVAQSISIRRLYTIYPYYYLVYLAQLKILVMCSMNYKMD